MKPLIDVNAVFVCFPHIQMCVGGCEFVVVTRWRKMDNTVVSSFLLTVCFLSQNAKQRPDCYTADKSPGRVSGPVAFNVIFSHVESRQRSAYERSFSCCDVINETHSERCFAHICEKLRTLRDSFIFHSVRHLLVLTSARNVLTVVGKFSKFLNIRHSRATSFTSSWTSTYRKWLVCTYRVSCGVGVGSSFKATRRAWLVKPKERLCGQ